MAHNTTDTPQGCFKPVKLKYRTWSLRDELDRSPTGAPLFHTEDEANAWLVARKLMMGSMYGKINA